MRRTRLPTLVGVACIASVTAAQAPAPNDGDASDGSPIVVTGKSGGPSRAEVFQQARNISRIDPKLLYVQALARFEAPVCPGVIGLTADGAGMVVDRIRANAARLKVRLAGSKCSPNLVVAIVDNGRTLLNDLERDRPGIAAQVSDEEKTELFDADNPVRVWNNIGIRWVGAGKQPRDEKRASVWGQMDRSSMPEEHDIRSALVVFDRKAVIGMTLQQLADYATMRGLSHTRPASGTAPMATILSLFDNDGGGPDQLTSFDVGYLQSLYWWKANNSAVDKLLGVKKRAAKAAKDAVQP